jgi:hypothetical protein
MLFAVDWERYGGVSARLQSADNAADIADYFLPLTLENQQRRAAHAHYIISALVRNQQDRPAQLRRAVIMLYDRHQQIIGYRIVPLQQVLAAGESTPFQASVMPQFPGDVADHSLYIEAQAASS